MVYHHVRDVCLAWRTPLLKGTYSRLNAIKCLVDKVQHNWNADLSTSLVATRLRGERAHDPQMSSSTCPNSQLCPCFPSSTNPQTRETLSSLSSHHTFLVATWLPASFPLPPSCLLPSIEPVSHHAAFLLSRFIFEEERYLESPGHAQATRHL